jgi:diguanylate cyclase (GGDEF)-like protein
VPETAARVRPPAPATPAGLWVLIAALATASLTLAALALAGLPRLDVPFDPPWWVVAAGYAVAEVLVVHLQFRRDTHTFSMSEVPFVVGLFFLAPLALIAALVLGTGMALAVHRRQSPVKLAFNLANLTLSAGIGTLVFREIVRAGDPLGAPGWLAATLAAVTSDAITLVMISVAVRLATGQLTDLRKLLGSGAVAAFFNTCLALVFVTLLWVRPDATWLPALLAGLMVAAYRIYGRVRQKQESLEVLYEAARQLQSSPDSEAVMATLLHEAQEMFRSEQAEVLLFGTDDGSPIEMALAGDAAVPTIRHPGPLEATVGVWARVASEGTGIALPRPIRNPRLRSHYDELGIADLMVAPLVTQDRVIGVIQVANRRGALTFDPDELHLLETFANHASAALEGARLIGTLRRQADESRHQARHDALTDLPNRLLFREAIEDAAQRSRGGMFAVALLDLDKFKEVNDTLGHQIGDRLLQAVADRLAGTIRPADVVARMGGDEFGILFSGVADLDDVERVARAIDASFAVPFDVDGVSLEVTGCLGIALWPIHGQDPDVLIQRADVAMYAAKADFRRHVVYEPNSDPYSPTRLLLVGELRRAIDRRELAVAFQPELDLATGRIVGAEALVRWPHAIRGNVPPDEFIPIAEHTGLLRPLTTFVLETAFETCAGWRRAGHDLRIAVNLSIRNLLDDELPDEIARLLERFELPPASVELEVTESALIADPTRSHAVLQALRDLGVGIAIDDYGTGYSSLAYLRRMPVTVLKIDRSFVAGMAEDENDRLIVASTIQLAHQLGLRVTAEGVESAGQAEMLRSLDCDLAQGFQLGRPVSAKDFFALVSQRADRPAAHPRSGTSEPIPLRAARRRSA